MRGIVLANFVFVQYEGADAKEALAMVLGNNDPDKDIEYHELPSRTSVLGFQREFPDEEDEVEEDDET